MLLNKINKEGILSKPFKSVLFSKAKIITQIWEGLINIKNL